MASNVALYKSQPSINKSKLGQNDVGKLQC